MLQWFITFSEFAEFSEFLFHLHKKSLPLGFEIVSALDLIWCDKYNWNELHTHDVGEPQYM